MIKRLIIKGLFNEKGNDYDLTFHEDLNIFTGRNGSGKTTIMKILWLCFSGHFDILFSEVVFDELNIEGIDGAVQIKKASITNKKNMYHVIAKDKDKEAVFLIDADTIKREGDIVDTDFSIFFPTFRRIEGGFSIPFKKQDAANNNIYKAFDELSDNLSSATHKFIAYVSSSDLEREINAERAEKSAIKDKINADLSQQIIILAKAGNNEAILEAVAKAQTRIDALDIKFKVLNELVDKFIKKRVQLDNKLTIGTDETLRTISSAQLSAGEKQFFAFLCYNLFAENTSIFIDEPEISLHPDWQRSLVPLLLKQASNNQFFMATHSDLIVAAYPHKEIILNANKGI
jgi:predicted ATP-dependent endonuclease of OLD family